ncbi:MAG: hypothetical protein WC516_05265 [Patescibacteria group bacterium]|jgi:dUTPase
MSQEVKLIIQRRNRLKVIYRINKDNPLPTQANPNDAWLDCYASEDVVFDE